MRRTLVAIMFVTMAGSALLVDGIFNLFDLVPDERPEIESITERSIEWNYAAVLNIVAAVVAGALIWLTVRRGSRDPVCGMAVDRLKATFASEYRERRYVFCGPYCKQTFDAAPQRYT